VRTRHAHGAGLLLLIWSTAAHAQLVQVQAGSSSLYDAHGASVDVRQGRTTVSLGAGTLNGAFTAGLTVRTRVRSFLLSAGDQIVDFDLPTDVFGGSRYVPVRGGGLERTTRSGRLLLLGGVTSRTTGAPFFRGAHADDGVGLMFVERRVSPRTTFFSKNAVGETVTSISGVSWRPRDWATLGAAGGAGSGRPYGVLSAELTRPRLQIAASLVEQRAGFRRITLDSPLSVEPTKENVSVTARLRSWWSVSLQRRRMLDDLAPAPASRGDVSLNQAGADVNVRGFRFTSNVYASSAPGRADQLGISASVGRRLTAGTDVMLDYFRSSTTGDSPSESYVARVHTTLSPRLAVLQALTRTSGQTTYHAGGEFLSNPLRVTVTYNTVYAPLRQTNPFVHVLGIDGQVHLFDEMTLNVATYTTPHGVPRYTISGMIAGSRAPSGGRSAARGVTLKMARFIVRGRVQDEAGDPVAGAVMRLGNETVATDRDGRFFWRTERRTPLRLLVVPDEFLVPGRFEVVSAPATLQPASDPSPADESVIVVRRV
jgi:hypothetical protein